MEKYIMIMFINLLILIVTIYIYKKIVKNIEEDIINNQLFSYAEEKNREFVIKKMIKKGFKKEFIKEKDIEVFTENNSRMILNHYDDMLERVLLIRDIKPKTVLLISFWLIIYTSSYIFY